MKRRWRDRMLGTTPPAVDWHGDPRVFSSSEFRERCELLLRDGGADAVIVYLWTFEQADERGLVRVPAEAESLRAQDLPDYDRLSRVADAILSTTN